VNLIVRISRFQDPSGFGVRDLCFPNGKAVFLERMYPESKEES